MAIYKFDGRELRDAHSELLGELEGNYIRVRNVKAGRIDGSFIRGADDELLAQVDGELIRDPQGAPIGTLDGLRQLIEGTGGTALAALWVLLVRQAAAAG
jgi:hypothetical protein